MKDLVSVIIPTYGRPKSIDIAIQSVLCQTFGNVEVVVVDDNPACSPERALTEEFMQKYEENGKVNYYKHETNRGGCAARNTGILNAKGEYIAFLDDDDRYLPKYIEQMVARAEEIKADMVYMTKAYCDDGEYIWKSRDIGECYPEGNVFESVLTGKLPICIFFLIRKEFIKQIGMFDESLRGFQDCDIWFKASRSGKLAAMKQSLAIYSRDCRERVTSNPYKREKALNDFVEKWIPQLSKEQNKIFENFIAFHQNQINLYKEIFDIEQQQKGMVSLRKYMKIELPFSMKLQLILVKLFGDVGNRIYRYIRFHICKKHFDFLKG